MKIEILGTGCHKCIELESLIDGVLISLGKTDAEVVRVSDERQIRHHMPLDQIPGLIIDGMMASTGEVPTRAQLVEWLSGVSVPGAG